jgi:hypothetical protein
MATLYSASDSSDMRLFVALRAVNRDAPRSVEAYATLAKRGASVSGFHWSSVGSDL